MKRTTRVCLSLTALWILGACGNANATQAQDVNTAKPEPDYIVIQGATIVETITDERVIEAVRRDAHFELCSSPSTATLYTVQVEEFEGYKHLTYVINDENGRCAVASQDYEPDAMPGYTSASDGQ